MAYPFRIPRQQWPTCYVLLLNLVLSLWVYEPPDEYVIMVLFAMAVTLVCLLWWFGHLEKPLWQAFSVLLIFTWPFSKIASESELKFRWNELLFIRISAGFAAVKLLTFLPSSFPRSFSSGELCVILQLAIPFLSTSAACLLNNYLRLEDPLCGIHKSSRVIQFLAIGLTLFVVGCKFIVAKFKRKNSAILLYICLVASICLSYLALLRSLRSEPLQWLLHFVTSSKSRITLMLKWAACLLINVSFAALWTMSSTGTAGTKIRKIFHLGISAVFVIGIKEDVELLSFCSACLLIVLIMLECWRICKLWPLSGVLEKCVSAFRDEKDAGILTTTHIYLLIGCALPLWLLPAGSRASLVTYSGVISVGFGDTAASVIGSHGRIRWSDSKKTIEGTTAALIAQLFASVALWYYLNPAQVLTTAEVLVLALISGVVALIETKLRDIDNLVLPIYHHGLMLLAKVWLPRF